MSEMSRPERSTGRPRKSVGISRALEFHVDHFMELSKTDIGKL